MDAKLEKEFIDLLISPLKPDDIVESLNRMCEIKSMLEKIWETAYAKGASDMRAFEIELSKKN